MIYDMGFSQNLILHQELLLWLVQRRSLYLSRDWENSVVLWRTIIRCGYEREYKIFKMRLLLMVQDYILPIGRCASSWFSRSSRIIHNRIGNLSALSFGVTTVHDPPMIHSPFAASELKTNQIGTAYFSTGRLCMEPNRWATAKVESYEDAKEQLDRMKVICFFSKIRNQPRRDQPQIVAVKRNQMMALLKVVLLCTTLQI